MNQIHIHITGPAQSGKTTVATKIGKALRELGYVVNRTENGGPIPRDRMRHYDRHEWPTFEPREVTINDQWGPEESKERARKAVEGLCAVFAQICDAAGIDIEETTITAKRHGDGSTIAVATLAEIMKRARESVEI